jgi:hypothetical protein
MTTKEKRKEIYDFVTQEIKNPTGKEQSGLSKLLKEYAQIVRDEQPQIPTKTIIKERIVYKEKKKTEDNYWE